MRQKIQHIALLCVVLLCFALDGAGQVEYKCSAIKTECETCYELHRKQLGWQCPNNSDWASLGQIVQNFAGAKAEKGGTSWSDRINLFQTVSGMEYKIQNLHGKTFILECGDAMIFTDDGGIQSDGKYCQIPRLVNKCIELDKVDKSKCIKWGDCPSPSRCVTDPKVRMDYDFNIKSADGVPLRVRVFEIGLRANDVLKFHDAQTGEVVKVYGYPNSWNPKTKDVNGNFLYGPVPDDFEAHKPSCSGYNWCRYHNVNPAPVDENPNMEQMFYITSGEAKVTWDKRHRDIYERTKVKDGTLPNIEMRGNVVRAGWVMVVDVLSAKVKSISLSEVAECKPDNIAVTYDVYVGAKNQNAKEVRFYIENEQTGLVLDTTVFNVNSANNPNTMIFNSKRLGGAGNYKVRITSVSDDWSSAPVSSEVSGSVSLRVKPNPSLILTDTTICSGQEGRVRLMAKDHTIPFRVIAESEENGVFVFAWTQDIYKLGAKPGFGPLHWRSGSSYTDTYSYRIRIVNLENNKELCGSNWFNYNVNVLKIPETGEQYHVPN